MENNKKYLVKVEVATTYEVEVEAETTTKAKLVASKMVEEAGGEELKKVGSIVKPVGKVKICKNN